MDAALAKKPQLGTGLESPANLDKTDLGALARGPEIGRMQLREDISAVQETLASALEASEIV